MRLSRLWLGLLTSAAAILPVHAEAADRPNILYIVADDLGWADVGFRGSDIRTPNIDQLAANGARLDDFYVQPMCTPTRAALMTGRYPLRYGLQSFVILPEQSYGVPLDERLLPQVLKDSGYQTAIVGKWHLGHADSAYWPTSRGFDYQYGPLIGEIDYFTHQVHGVTDWYRNGATLEEKGYSTTLLGDDAVRVVDSQDASKPFFLYLAFNAPHTPYQVPEADLAPYGDIKDPNRRAYAAMVTAMDTQIGRVLDALKEKGLRDNTLIIFHSDNGGVRTAAFAGQIETGGDLPASNGPLRDGKGSLYEGGTRVGAVVNWPGHVPAGEVHGLVHVVDMLPTIADVAGASTEGTLPLDGVDQWPTIAEGKPSPRTGFPYNVEMFRGGVRDGDWKLVWKTPLPASLELFDLSKDPDEKTNVAAEHPETVERLKGEVETLADQMKPSLFMQATAASYFQREVGPPLLPSDPAYFDQGD